MDLTYIAMFAPIVPVVIGVSRWKRTGIGQKLLILLSIFYLLNQSLAELLSRGGLANYPLFHLHVVIELSVLCWIYFEEHAVFHGRLAQLILTVSFCLVGIANAVIGEGWLNPPSKLLIAESTILTLFAGLYFLKVFKEMMVAFVEREFLFWLSLGILVFFLGTMLLSFTVDYILTQHDQLFYDVFLIRAVLIILTNICYAIGMLCKAHPQKS